MPVSGFELCRNCLLSSHLKIQFHFFGFAECGANWQEPDDNANEIDVERIMEEVKQVPSDMRQRLIDEVIETVTQAHLETVTPTHQKVQEANERFMKKQMEGHLVRLLNFFSSAQH